MTARLDDTAVGIEITLAGVVGIRGSGDNERYIGSAQVQIAFTRLIIERSHGTAQDDLVDTLWPNNLPATWRSRLRTVVSLVRSVLKEALQLDSDPVVVRAGKYMLHLPEEVSVDIELAEGELTTARKALASLDFPTALTLAGRSVDRLRFPLLPNHEGEWVTAYRERLTELRLGGLESASTAAAALGEGANALAYANEAIRAAPWRETAHRCCMRAHAAVGNRAEALRAYERLRQSLAEELGVDPSPETEALYVKLLGPPVVPSRSSTKPDRDDGSR